MFSMLDSFRVASYRACVDLAQCPKQSAALDQCLLEKGDGNPICRPQQRHFDRCKLIAQMVADPDFAARGTAMARLEEEPADAAEAARNRREERLRQDLFASDIGGPGVL
jgi:hypothetical protein